MSQDDLENLRNATQALYLEAHSKVARILAKEAAVRNGLARLEEQNRGAGEPTNGVDSMQMIGADLLWNAWQYQTRQRLNVELAQIRAQRMELMDGVRLAFGRDQAILTLVEQQKTELAEKQEKRNTARILGWT